ncbi:hypothetical protein ACFQ1L_25450 [Phytohabitans flavus]|uniref:hypothetical protein n=1 Tax=Phytohabitans flavus TaxID=1076124 RepID=UPI003644021D
MSSSASVTVCRRSRRTSSSSGNSSSASPRNTAVQLGSRPRIGVPARRCGRRMSTVRSNTRLAVSSWPVEIQVSPQQTGCSGTTARHPAASISSTAARAISGSKRLVKVSGHSTTSPRSPVPRGPRSAYHRWKLWGANTGSWRRVSTPAAFLASQARPGACARALTSLGVVAETTAAASGSQPIE